MTGVAASVTRPTPLEVVFTRLFNAPRALVWTVWTEPAHLHEWWGPTGFTTTTHEFAFVPDGVWRHVMHGPDGTDYPTRIVFREIDEPSRIVYDTAWDLAGAPLDYSVVVTLEEEDAKTRMSLHMTFKDDDAVKVAVERYGVLQGGVQTFERIASLVEALRDSAQRSGGATS